jgi:hypothetical protein
MGGCTSAAASPSLHAPLQGELTQVRISVVPHQLEELLDCLAHVVFPINPQIYPGVPTVVEFPAWEADLWQVRNLLEIYGFPSEAMRICPMLETLSK